MTNSLFQVMAALEQLWVARDALKESDDERLRGFVPKVEELIREGEVLRGDYS